MKNGNYVDIETHEGYWISRIKRNGEDRHWTGHGKIKIDRRAVVEYMNYRKLKELKTSQYTIVEIIELKGPKDFYEIENKKLDETIMRNQYEDYFKKKFL